jgi:hypothetical protein
MGSRQVAVQFLDNENFYGYESQDIAGFGTYRVNTRLCCITKWTGTSFSANDGILGMGLMNSEFSPSILLTLIKQSRPDWGIMHQPSPPLPKPFFAILANPHEGELQLGGVDPASYEGEMIWSEMAKGPFWGRLDYIPYALQVQSLRVIHTQGSTELLFFDSGGDFGPGHHNHSVALLDTGGACTLLPWGQSGGVFKEGSAPWQVFHEMMNAKLSGLDDVEHSTIEVTLTNNKRFSFPLSVWVGSGCIQPIGGNMLIFGSTFFQHFVVGFDVSKKPYKAGIAKINSKYKMATEPVFHHMIQKMPMLVRPVSDMYGRQPGQAMDKTWQSYVMPAMFLLPVRLGTPAQTANLILDTGSYMLAVHCTGVDLVADREGIDLIKLNRTSTPPGFGVLKTEIPFTVVKADPQVYVAGEADVQSTLKFSGTHKRKKDWWQVASPHGFKSGKVKPDGIQNVYPKGYP